MEEVNDYFVNSSLSNKKRLSSQHLNEKRFRTQQHQIKAALAKVDCPTLLNKKIVFNLEDEKQSSEIHNDHRQKRILFDDSDSSESESTSNLTKEHDLNYLFRVRSQFEGGKGQKLLKLQSQFKNDERFQLDERFLENDDDDEAEGLEKLDTTNILEERKKNFEILQNVVGFQFPIESSNKRPKQYYKDMNKLRYDPTSEDAKKFEVKNEPKQKDLSKKQKQTEATPIVLPEVSKDQYFQISSDLKTSFNQPNEEFCLLKQFSKHNSEKSTVDKEEDDYHTEPLFKTKKTLYLKKDVFKYDSSDEDEDGTTHQIDQFLEDTRKQNCENVEWKFFLSDDDLRLQGVKYFQRTETEEEISQWWKETRPKMLDIIHSKVKTFKHRVLTNNKGKRRK